MINLLMAEVWPNNSKVLILLNQSLKSDHLYDDKVLPNLNTYYEWIQQSKLQYHGLSKFNKLDYVHGTTQSFDFLFKKKIEE